MLVLETKPKNVKEAIEAGWMTAKEIYETAGVDRRTWVNFLDAVRKAVSEKCITGAHNTKYFHPDVMKAFQLWLKKNAMNAGGQRTEGSIVKQDNQQDLFIGCIATKGTPDEIRSLALHLQEFANQKEMLEQTN